MPFVTTAVAVVLLGLLEACTVAASFVRYHPQHLSSEIGMSSSKAPNDSETSTGAWNELSPSTFDDAVSRDSFRAQTYKDTAFKDAVLKAWSDEHERQSLPVLPVETATIAYADLHGTPLHGHVVRRKDGASSSPLGVLFFHTAAGPHDIFLLWKAASLLQHVSGTVLVCDLFSDSTGWGWDVDRTRYGRVRDALFADLEDGTPPLLDDRVQACHDTLLGTMPPGSIKGDGAVVAAVGWCFGGHPILQLAKMRHRINVYGLATFHGVFDTRMATIDDRPKSGPDGASRPSTAALLCHGEEDPFVSLNDVMRVAQSLESFGCSDVRVMEMKGARHGFSNPAQDLNPNPAFGHHKNAADRGWAAVVEMIRGLVRQ